MSWKPDFNKPNPWEGMPQEYVEKEAAAYKPTPEQPLPPSQRTPEGLAARERAPEVSKALASIQLAPGSTPDQPVLTPEDYTKFEALPDQMKFEKLVQLGVIEEGSQYVPALKVDWSKSGLSPSEIAQREARMSRLSGLPIKEWGIYTPEQVAEIQRAEEEAQAKYETKVAAITQAQEAVAKRIAREKKEFEATLKDMPKDFQKAYEEGGIEGYNNYVLAYNKAFERSHILLPNEQWIDKKTANKVKKQSEYGYNILINQGIDAYNKAVNDALKEVKSFKRGGGYNLRRAAAQGVSLETLSLIFPSGDIEKVENFYREPATPIETLPNKTTSALPKELVAALPVISAIAVAEPTLIGEAIVATAILAALTYAVFSGKDLNWNALISDIKNTYKKEQDRAPTSAEIEQMELSAASIIKASAIPTVNVPQAIAMKAYEAPPWQPGAVPIIEMPSMIVTKAVEREPWTPAGVPTIEMPSMIVTKAVEREPWTPAGVPIIDVPQIIMAQAQIATADEELTTTIIRPKIMTPSQLDTLWNVPLGKKAQALVALDAAVQDAFTSEEIDEDVLRVYSQARANYLVKKGLLDAAMKTYIGGMQPELSSSVNELSASALSIAIADLQDKANKAANRAYSEAIQSDATQAQAMQLAQTAAENAIKDATNTATQNAIKAATQTVTQTATKAAVKTATKTATKAATNAIVQVAVKSATQTAVISSTPIILSSGGKGKEPKLSKEELRSASAWPQGFGWWVVFIRDGKKYAFFHHGQKPPQGIKQVKQGKGEAYRGIQQFIGKNARFKLPMGAVSVAVSEPESEPGRVGAIRFTPKRPSITPKRPKVK